MRSREGGGRMYMTKKDPPPCTPPCTPRRGCRILQKALLLQRLRLLRLSCQVDVHVGVAGVACQVLALYQALDALFEVGTAATAGGDGGPVSAAVCGVGGGVRWGADVFSLT
jgi:hypothetical protein